MLYSLLRRNARSQKIEKSIEDAPIGVLLIYLFYLGTGVPVLDEWWVCTLCFCVEPRKHDTMKNLFSVALLTIALSSCNNQPKEKSAEELKHELLLQEWQNPKTYLVVATVFTNKNEVKVSEESFLHDAEYADDGYIVSGTVKNTASLAAFKNLVFEISYKGEDGSEILSENFTLQKTAQPNSSLDYEFKVHPPEGTNNYIVSISNASSVNQ